MLLPLTWMKDYLNIDISSKEIADKVTLTGSHVESVIDLSVGLEKIIVSKILKIKKHPDADKLSIVTLDYGNGEIDVITGAKNMKEGDFVAFAQVGAKLPNGLEIKPIKLVGIESPGMLCSYEELGYSKSLVPKNSQDGIIILEEGNPGTPITEVLELTMPIIEFEITPNRPDCLSIVGMSREVAATFKDKIEVPEFEIKNEEDDIKNYFKDVVIESEDCYRYMGKVVKDVVIKESPQWLKNRLMQSGMRPINNIVDITNFVLLELGQPIHAFDLDTIKSKEIHIKKPSKDIKFTTLDNEERTLTSDDLVIYDKDEPAAIAGVMGGLDSDVKDNTKTIFIESASFSPDSVRDTSKRLNLRTEASARYEKGVPVEFAEIAINRVCNLIEITNSGTVVAGQFDIGEKESKKVEVNFNYNKINELLGTSLSKDEIISYLEDLEFVVNSNGEDVNVKVPFFRTDISIVEDIAEEVGRLYGFHNITPMPLRGDLLSGRKSERRQVEDRIKHILYGCGLFEIMTYSFISKKSYAKASIKYNPEESIELINPLGEDFSVMRTTTLTNILDVLEKNSKNKIPSMKVYELANTFLKDSKGEYGETKKIGFGMYGDVDFYSLKEVVETLLKELGIKNTSYVALTDNATYHPGRAAKIYIEDVKIGEIGEISFGLAKNYDITSRAYIGELDLIKIMPYIVKDILMEEISKYPTVERDIAIVIDRDLETDVLEKFMIENGSELLKSVELFDVYMGGNIEKDKKSSAYKLKFQSKDRTLREEEISEIMKNILSKLEDKFNAQLRS